MKPPVPVPVEATLWLPEDLDAVVLQVTAGRLELSELDALRDRIEERFSAPALIVSGGIVLEVRRYS